LLAVNRDWMTQTRYRRVSDHSSQTRVKIIIDSRGLRCPRFLPPRLQLSSTESFFTTTLWLELSFYGVYFTLSLLISTPFNGDLFNSLSCPSRSLMTNVGWPDTRKVRGPFPRRLT
jgi:hypothetical protein